MSQDREWVPLAEFEPGSPTTKLGTLGPSVSAFSVGSRPRRGRDPDLGRQGSTGGRGRRRRPAPWSHVGWKCGQSCCRFGGDGESCLRVRRVLFDLDLAGFRGEN